MAGKEYIKDQGNYLDVLKNIPITEPFETISNYLSTIKEYHDYATPGSPDWVEYVLEIFHVMGFQTESFGSRLFSLKDIGNNGVAKAIVAIVHPGESFEDIVPGLDWISYLFYTGYFYSVNWGILTNGIDFKAVQISRDIDRTKYFLTDIEGIIQDHRLDSFFTFYKLFKIIMGKVSLPKKTQTGTSYQRNKSNQLTKYDLNYYITGKPQFTINLYETLKTKVLSLSSSIKETYNKLYISYSSGKIFCQIRIQQNELIVWVELSIDEIDENRHLCRDVRKIGHYGTGKTELRVKQETDIAPVFAVIQQSFNHTPELPSRNYDEPIEHEYNNLRRRFWRGLIEKSKSKSKLFANISPKGDNWISASGGKSGFMYLYVVRLNDAQVDLYIDVGNKQSNKKIFNSFISHKAEIETKFGEKLLWELMPNKRASRIKYIMPGYGVDDIDSWDELQERMVDAMTRLETTFQSYVLML